VIAYFMIDAIFSVLYRSLSGAEIAVFSDIFIHFVKLIVLFLVVVFFLPLY
jgi:hypothetical protein